MEDHKLKQAAEHIADSPFWTERITEWKNLNCCKSLLKAKPEKNI